MNIKIIFLILVIAVIVAFGTFFFLTFNTPPIGIEPLEPVAVPEESSSTANLMEKPVPRPNPEKTTLPENSENPPVSPSKNTAVPATPTTPTTPTTPNTFFTLLEGDSVFLAKDDGTLSSNDDVDVNAVTKRFFQSHPDQYDFIAIFTDFPGNGSNFNLTVKNPIQGLGIDPWDNSTSFGSSGTLKAVVVEHVRPSVDNSYTFIDLAHEISHYWLAYIPNQPSLPINRDGAHWSKWFDTAVRSGSCFSRDPNGGGAYVDNGDGTFSLDPKPGCPPSKGTASHKVNSLDLYLMGLIPVSEVTPLTLWIPDDPSIEPSDSPAIKGTKKIVTVDDIIKIAGQRSPAYPNTQKDFKVAYIYLAKGVPSDWQINNIKWIAQNFPQEWSFVTGGRSTISPVK